jgi:quinol-cytochrome oxidoreductase complex cytochrome b subunit
MRDVPYGWFIDIFMLMVLFFFHCCYAHLVRGLFYGSYFYPRVFYGAQELYFIINDINLILRLCFTWGQMSYRAATVLLILLLRSFLWTKHCEVVMEWFFC